MKTEILQHTIILTFRDDTDHKLSRTDIDFIQSKIIDGNREGEFEFSNTSCYWKIEFCEDQKYKIYDEDEDISTCLYSTIEEETVLDLRNGNKIRVESFQDDMDGVFPRVNEWTRFANNIDNKGIDWWVNKNIKFYGFSKVKEEYSNYETRFILEFEKPINACIGKIGDRFLIEKIKSIKCGVSYEWYFIKNGRQDKIANGIDIYLENVELLS